LQLLFKVLFHNGSWQLIITLLAEQRICYQTVCLSVTLVTRVIELPLNYIQDIEMCFRPYDRTTSL